MSENDIVRVKNVDGALATARQHLEAGELDAAEALYGTIRAERPDRWEGHMGLSHVLALRGDAGGALALLPEAVKAEPGCMPAYQLLAQLGINGGVSDIAIEWLEFGAQHQPAEPQLFEWLVCLYAVDGRLDDLRNCLVHYARLRGLSVHDTALLFSRDPRISEDVRSRIAQAAGF